jgi:hypothetical protein
VGLGGKASSSNMLEKRIAVLAIGNGEGLAYAPDQVGLA